MPYRDEDEKSYSPTKKSVRTRFPQALHKIVGLCTRPSTFLAKKLWISGLLLRPRSATVLLSALFSPA